MKTNAFFTLKWPHVIALLLSNLDPKNSLAPSDLKEILDKFSYLQGLDGVKQHQIVRGQVLIHELLTRVLLDRMTPAKRMIKRLEKAIGEFQLSLDIHWHCQDMLS